MLVALIGSKINGCESGRDLLFSWVPVRTVFSCCAAGDEDTCCNTSTSHAGTIHYLVAIKLVIIQLLRVFGICALSDYISCHLDF